MAPVTPVGVPATLVAGDTLLFSVSYGDFPVSEGWLLSMSIVGAGQLQTTAGEITEDDGVTWTVTVPASRTATLNSQPGVYRWFHYMTGSGSYAGIRYTVAEGRIEILANPAQAQNGDFRFQEEKDLEVIDAAIAGRITDDMKAYTIRGRQVVMLELSELRNLRRDCVQRLRRRQGLTMPRLVRVYHGP
jgi:hypothetical protein